MLYTNQTVLNSRMPPLEFPHSALSGTQTLGMLIANSVSGGLQVVTAFCCLKCPSLRELTLSELGGQGSTRKANNSPGLKRSAET